MNERLTDMVTIAAYRFVPLQDLVSLRLKIYAACRSRDLKGTVLLAPEGINLFLAGRDEAVREIVQFLHSIEGLEGMPVKYNPVDYPPFNRLLVRLKKEIIPLGLPHIQPHVETSPKISPRELKQRLDSGEDLILLDVRNDYEVEVGTFVGAHPAGIRHFREFPAAVARFPPAWKHRPIVMFCTGGIRCEKAGPVLQQAGFEKVWQLDGGILKYFEDCGGHHYQGDCFVFDQRVAVDPSLHESDMAVCFRCQAVLSPADQKRPEYQPPESCHHCYRTEAEIMQATIERRHQRLSEIYRPLPGSVPYANVRPLRVPGHLDGATVEQLLQSLLGHCGIDYWQREIAAGNIRRANIPLSGRDIVRSGWRIEHVTPCTREPDVATDIRILHEDRWIVVVDKPAPLPVHPCGRFNRNTLIYLLNQVYRPEVLRPAHRLDADTMGLIVLSRNRESARRIQPLFERQEIEKVYLARVQGHPPHDFFECEATISAAPEEQGKRRSADDGGLAAKTHFRVIARHGDGTATCECRPLTGRTNQIRLHLAHCGFPIVGDRWYGQDRADERLVNSPNNDGGSTKLLLLASRLIIPHPFLGRQLEFISHRTLD